MLEWAMKKKTAKSYHHGGLRGALVAAGRAILEEEGATALTLRACARRAGVSHAAPQHHFATVAELLAEIAATGFEDFVVALDKDAAREVTPSAKLTAMGRSYVGFAQARPAIYQLMFAAPAPMRSERLQKAMTAAWNQLVDGVSAAAGPKDVNAKATLVWSTVHGFAMLTIIRRLPPTVDEAAALELMSEGLARAIGGRS
jgi:AcrR family transcriptional regulator